MKKMEGQVVCGGHNLVYAGMSHKGQVRKINEDDFLIMPEFQIFCVADGMGGYERGEVASRLTVEAIGQYIENLAETSSENPSAPGGFPAYRSTPGWKRPFISPMTRWSGRPPAAKWDRLSSSGTFWSS